MAELGLRRSKPPPVPRVPLVPPAKLALARAELPALLARADAAPHLGQQRIGELAVDRFGFMWSRQGVPRISLGRNKRPTPKSTPLLSKDSSCQVFCKTAAQEGANRSSMFTFLSIRDPPIKKTRPYGT